MAHSKSPDEHAPGEDTALLLAALNHAWAMYDAHISRGLQVINYFLVASAVLATAYVSAISGKHYAIAAVISLSGTALAGLTYLVGRLQRRAAAEAELALAELQGRVAKKLDIRTFRIARPDRGRHRDLSVQIVFGLAILLSLGSALYALVR